MINDKNVIKITLETPIEEWRRHNLLTIDKKDLSLLGRILPRNVRQVYINDKGKTLDIKLILFG
jgi:hypothetical protein